jgi:Na+-translocating ferredoxin:NAD+ oxidoreductase RNF subunit RnfB
LSNHRHATCFVRFNQGLCTGCASCLRVCPTKAIRIKKKKSIRFVDQCIGCGECIRRCPVGAVSASVGLKEVSAEDHISVALVSPVLYAQFPGVMPQIVLHGLKQMGFQHTIDMSYFLEMFQYATEEFIKRNKASQKAPWPLISPVCPVVIRLIAYRFPNLMPHVLPVLRPVALMAREVKNRLIPEYDALNKQAVLYYINPCPTKMAPECYPAEKKQSPPELAIGINDIYAELRKHVEKTKESDMIPFSQTRFEFETCATGNASMWAMSGGEISDMEIEHSLAVSGMEETIAYLEKIEMGLLRDVEYIELRTCREGCLGGVLTAIDKYQAKSAVQKMVKKFGLGRRLSRETILRQYQKGKFQLEKEPAELVKLFGAQKKSLSLDSLMEIEKTMELFQGKTCASCGAPNCRTFAEDIIRGDASLDDCTWLQSKK